jgi:hypothetical protein
VSRNSEQGIISELRTVVKIQFTQFRTSYLIDIAIVEVVAIVMWIRLELTAIISWMAA